MFLSLHDKFIWFQVVPMLYISSRHLQELLLSILLKLVHFYLKLLKISDCFRNNEETFEGLIEPKLEGKTKGRRTKPKFNLPHTVEVRPYEWPSDDFLRRAGIYEDFYLLIKNAGLTDLLCDQRHQYLLLTNTFVQNFYFSLRNHLHK